MKATVTQLTDQLLVSYAKVGGINHLDGKNLPSKTVIAGITCDLLRLLFPGFFDEKTIHSSELKVELVSLMDSVLGRLQDEVYKSLEYSTPAGLSKNDLRRAAQEMTQELLGSLPRIREVLKTDVDAAFNGDPAALSQEEIIVAYPFVETIAVCTRAPRLVRISLSIIAPARWWARLAGSETTSRCTMASPWERNPPVTSTSSEARSAIQPSRTG